MKLIPNTPDYLSEVPWYLTGDNNHDEHTFFCQWCEKKEPHVWHDDGTPNQEPLF